MMKKEIKPYSEFSTSYKIFTTVFLLCFSLLFTYLIIFQVDDIRIVPCNSSVYAWIKYCINVILDFAIFGIFGFGNYYVIKINFKTKKDKEEILDTDRKTTKHVFFAVIFTSVICLKILYGFLDAIIKAAVNMLQQDSHSVAPWLLLLVASAIAIGFFLIYRYIFKCFIKANKILSTGKMDIFKGVVTDKQRIYSPVKNTNLRAGQLYTYNIKLDNGKEFLNIQRIYFESVEIGQAVEIHAIPEVGEILHFYVI